MNLKNSENLWVLGLFLGIIGLVSALILAVVSNLVAGPIEQAELRNTNQALRQILPEEKRDPLRLVLAQDPRPSYQEDPGRVYGMEFAGFEVKFTVSENVLHVQSVMKK